MNRSFTDFFNLTAIEFWQWKNKVKNVFINPITLLKMLAICIGIIIMLMNFSEFKIFTKSNVNNLNSDLLGAIIMGGILAWAFTILIKAANKYTPVQFSKSDVYYLFQSPISPRVIYIWTLVKDSLRDLALYFICVIIYWELISKYFTLEISKIVFTIYGIFLLVLFFKAFAFLMYLLSNKFNITNMIKVFNTSFWATLGIYSIINIIHNGISSNSFCELLNGRVFSNIPVVGWAKDMIIYPNATGKEIVFQSVALSFTVIITIALTSYFAVDYYEFVAEYLETNDNIWIKNKKDIDEKSFNKALGKLENLNITGEWAFLWKAIVERKRMVKFYYGYIGALVISCIIGFVLRKHEIKDLMTVYLMIFWMVIGMIPNVSTVKYELGKQYIYLLPGSFIKKVGALYTLPILSKITFNALLIIPCGIIVKMNFLDVILLWLVFCFSSFITLFGMLITHLIIPMEYDKELSFTSLINYIFLTPPVVVGIMIGIRFRSITLGFSSFCIISIVTLFLMLITSKKLFSKFYFNS